MSDQTTIQITIAEFLQLPESNLPCELIDGELLMAPAPKDNHQSVSLLIIALLLETVGGRGELRHQPTDVHINDQTVVQPDVFWVAENSHCKLGADGWWHGVPDLVIEILSPSTAALDRGRKYELYQEYGVREYWIVEPEALYVEVYSHTGDTFSRVGLFTDKQTFHSPLLDAEIDIKLIFQR